MAERNAKGLLIQQRKLSTLLLQFWNIVIGVVGLARMRCQIGLVMIFGRIERLRRHNVGNNSGRKR